ncbi:MAG: transposase [Methanobrevibacter sp.]|jgi:transposase-like protein|nr:transposase [Methanobrevibacter sp.]
MASKVLNHANMLPSEETCMDMFRSIRWSLGVYCPKCKSYEIHNRGSPFKTRYYSCKKCGLNFSDYTGTIFHKTKVPMNVIFYILFNLPFKSVNMISKELPYSRKTITRIANLIRVNLEDNYKPSKLSGDIEFDEMYIAAGNKGVKKNFLKKILHEKED